MAFKDSIRGVTDINTPWGGGSTDNPWVEGSIAGAIIVGTLAFATKYVMGK